MPVPKVGDSVQYNDRIVKNIAIISYKIKNVQETINQYLICEPRRTEVEPVFGGFDENKRIK